MRLSVLFGLFALAVSAACAGGRGGLEGSVYRDRQMAFRLGEVPTGWSRLQVDEATCAFRDEPHRASIMVNARCGRKDDDAPLTALTAHLLMGTTDRAIANEETIPFDGREALHTRLTAKLDGVPMAYDVFVLKKDGCVYDFVYVGEPTASGGGAPTFEQFVQGFHTIAGGS